MSGYVADAVLIAHANASRLYGVNYTTWLTSAELCNGTPTAVEETTTDLTIASVAVNTATFVDIRGNTVAIGKGIQFRVSGGTAGLTYTILVTTATDSSNTLPCKVRLKIGD